MAREFKLLFAFWLVVACLGPCEEKPCKDGSTCEPRNNQSFVCLCLVGDNYDYDSNRCVSAKVFPGLLQLPNLIYLESMSDNTSPEFQEASSTITQHLDEVFKDNKGSSQVVKLSVLSSKVLSRSTLNGIEATVDIIFKADVNINTSSVEDKIKAAGCTDCPLENPCDTETTICNSTDGDFKCTCSANYFETDLSNRVCIPCPIGKQISEDSKKCIPCTFGYSGLNCKETWKLTLVIVGSVFGGLLLIMLILLPVLVLKSSKKSSKKDKHADIGKPYVSHPPAKQPLVNSNFDKSQTTSVNGQANGLAAFANAGVPRIPRATTTNSWDSRTNLEMSMSNSRQNLIPVGRNSRLYDDHDDMNRYAQARPQNNPYAQNQPQTNPYAQSQGNSNPYYTYDNDRRLN
ncbi:mucin-13-like [Clinocottus analis]|uniref:mucin-13-like n=1 Tax=Clinocottus analis TaxID=304258 RepID=UPI0035C11102